MTSFGTMMMMLSIRYCHWLRCFSDEIKCRMNPIAGGPDLLLSKHSFNSKWTIIIVVIFFWHKMYFYIICFGYNQVVWGQDEKWSMLLHNAQRAWWNKVYTELSQIPVGSAFNRLPIPWTTDKSSERRISSENKINRNSVFRASIHE